MTDEPTNFYAEFKPTLWQRIAWWHRWPWRPKPDPKAHQWGREPWLVMVRENGVIIGWHPVPHGEGTTTIEVNRWSALAGLVTGRLRFEVSIDRDLKHAQADEAALAAAAVEGRVTKWVLMDWEPEGDC